MVGTMYRSQGLVLGELSRRNQIGRAILLRFSPEAVLVPQRTPTKQPQSNPLLVEKTSCMLRPSTGDREVTDA